MSKSTFFVRSSVNTQLGEVFDSLEMARSAEFRPAIPAYIEEYQSGNLNSKPICHSFHPPPQPTPPRAGIVDDITQSLAYGSCCVIVDRKIFELDLADLAGQAESQPHEDILSDVCRDVGDSVYRCNHNTWLAALPSGSVEEAERCIIEELTGRAQATLARRFRTTAASLLRAAEELERC